MGLQPDGRIVVVGTAVSAGVKVQQYERVERTVRGLLVGAKPRRLRRGNSPTLGTGCHCRQLWGWQRNYPNGLGLHRKFMRHPGMHDSHESGALLSTAPMNARSGEGIDQRSQHFIGRLGHIDAQLYLELALGHLDHVAGQV